MALGKKVEKKENKTAKDETNFETKLKENREKLWSLKNDLAQGKVKNVREIKKYKKEIARILTHMKNI